MTDTSAAQVVVEAVEPQGMVRIDRWATRRVYETFEVPYTAELGDLLAAVAAEQAGAKSRLQGYIDSVGEGTVDSGDDVENESDVDYELDSWDAVLNPVLGGDCGKPQPSAKTPESPADEAEVASFEHSEYVRHTTVYQLPVTDELRTLVAELAAECPEGYTDGWDGTPQGEALLAHLTSHGTVTDEYDGGADEPEPALSGGFRERDSVTTRVDLI